MVRSLSFFTFTVVFPVNCISFLFTSMYFRDNSCSCSVLLKFPVAFLFDIMEIGDPVSFISLICFPLLSSFVAEIVTSSEALFTSTMTGILGMFPLPPIETRRLLHKCNLCFDLQTLLKCFFLLQLLRIVFLAGQINAVFDVGFFSLHAQLIVHIHHLHTMH